MMRRLVVALVATLCLARAAQAHAQQLALPPLPPPEPPAYGGIPAYGGSEDLESYYESGQILRGFGIPLTLAGVGLFAASIYFFEHSNPCWFYCESWQDNGNFERAFWSLIGSFASVGVGIPLWAVGQHRINKAERLGYQPGLVLLPYVAPAPSGAVAGLTVGRF